MWRSRGIRFYLLPAAGMHHGGRNRSGKLVSAVCSEEIDQGRQFCFAQRVPGQRHRGDAGRGDPAQQGARCRGGLQGGRMQPASPVLAPLAMVPCAACKSKGDNTLVVAHGLRREPRPRGWSGAGRQCRGCTGARAQGFAQRGGVVFCLASGFWGTTAHRRDAAAGVRGRECCPL
jgi:hypothetical protein